MNEIVTQKDINEMMTDDFVIEILKTEPNNYLKNTSIKFIEGDAYIKRDNNNALSPVKDDSGVMHILGMIKSVYRNKLPQLRQNHKIGRGIDDQVYIYLVQTILFKKINELEIKLAGVTINNSSKDIDTSDDDSIVHYNINDDDSVVHYNILKRNIHTKNTK